MTQVPGAACAATMAGPPPVPSTTAESRAPDGGAAPVLFEAEEAVPATAAALHLRGLPASASNLFDDAVFIGRQCYPVTIVTVKGKVL